MVILLTKLKRLLVLFLLSLTCFVRVFLYGILGFCCRCFSLFYMCTIGDLACTFSIFCLYFWLLSFVAWCICWNMGFGFPFWYVGLVTCWFKVKVKVMHLYSAFQRAMPFQGTLHVTCNFPAQALSTVSFLYEGEPPPPISTPWGAYRPRGCL